MERRYLFLLWFDVSAVICLAVIPDLVNAANFARQGYQGDNFSFAYIHWWLITRSLQVAVPILLIMWLRKVDWRQHGFRRLRPLRDSATAMGLVVLWYLGYVLAYCIALKFELYDQPGADATSAMLGSMAPTTTIAVVLMLCSCAANGFAEELTLRGYLLPRLVELSGSKLAPVLVTSMLFSSYHIYQGPVGVMTAFFTGVVMGAYFVATRRLWPVAAAHAVMDVLPQVYYVSL